MKFFYVSVVFVVAILFNQLLVLLSLFLMPIPFVLIAGVQREWVRSLRGAAFLASFIFIVNIASNYFTSGYVLTIIDIESAIAMTLRFVVLVESFSVFFLTTSPDHLGLALEQTHIPYEFAFTTAVRFVPVLAEEAQTIMDAQKARGLELEKGGFLKRIRNYIPILIPLIVSAIRRSLELELAEAMESRAWGATKNRTNLYELRLHRGDFILLAISLLILAIAIYLRLYVSIPMISDLIF